jgi:tetratricopeptide (TPR) repeat protein
LASQKEKYLTSAQKFIQKGQLDRAIKDYEQVVASDPKDFRQRQKLAELLARCNRKDEAIKEYEIIAKHYDDNGFYLKSIAVYKQIQKLDNKNLDISYTLAALNEKQGLVGNALSEYKNIFDYYEKAGLSDEALKTLEKMQSVDPENLEIQIKLAETYCNSGQNDKAYQEYTRVALILKNRGNETVFDQVCRRIQTLFPERSEFILDLLAEQIKRGGIADVLPRLQQMRENDDKNSKVLTLLAEAYKIAGDTENRKSVCREVLEKFPDDVSAKAGLIECNIAEGDIENSIGLIRLYAPDLITAGSFAILEQFYTSLQNYVPYDIRIFEGLKALYEANGEQTKLADVLVSMNILSHNVPEQHAEFPPEEESTASADIPHETSHEMTEIDLPWEEEIELSIPGDEFSINSKAGEFGDELVLTDVEENAVGDCGEELFSRQPDDNSTSDLTAYLEIIPGTEDKASFEFDPSSISIEEGFAPESKSNEEEQQFFDSLNLDLEETTTPFEIEEAQIGMESAVEFSKSSALLSPEEAWHSGQKELLVPSASTGSGNGSNEIENTAITVNNDVSAISGKYAFDGMFSEFKKGLDQQVEQGDTETHYNLGIAYKEMGLYDDAIKEFMIASADRLRQADCLTLQGICLQEKGDLAKAEEVFLSGLETFKLDPENLLNIKYELALLYEIAKRKDESLRFFRDVFATNPGYRDTARKIAELHGADAHLDLTNIDEIDLEINEVG